MYRGSISLFGVGMSSFGGYEVYFFVFGFFGFRIDSGSDGWSVRMVSDLGVGTREATAHG